MEAYKTTCPDCGHIRFWVGYKTGFGKSPEQLKRMEEDNSTCQKCSSKRAITDSDRELEVGKVYEEQAKFLGEVIGKILNDKVTGEPTDQD